MKMDKSRALNTLIEAADLVSMLEELTKAADQKGAGSLPGMRITLRSIKDRVLAGHDVLAREILSNANSTTSRRTGDASSALISEQSPVRRRDLRSAVEKSSDPAL